MTPSLSGASGGGGVSQILAGDGVGVSPSGGEGVVTVSATGGSASSVKAVDLGIIDMAAIASGGPRRLYTMQAGEFLSSVRYTDTDYEDIDALPLPLGVGTVKSFGWWSFLPIQAKGGLLQANWAGANIGFWDTPSAPLYSLSYDPRSATLGAMATSNGAMILSAQAAGDVYASLFLPVAGGSNIGTAPGDGSSVRLDAIEDWVAATAYDTCLGSSVATAGVVKKGAVIANGTVWINQGAAGTSGDTSPDFASNAGGTVGDGPSIVWADSGVAMPTRGQVRAVAEIWTPITLA